MFRSCETLEDQIETEQQLSTNELSIAQKEEERKLHEALTANAQLAEEKLTSAHQQ